MSTEITISRLKLTLLCVWSSDWTLHKANDLLDADIAAHNHGWNAVWGLSWAGMYSLIGFWLVGRALIEFVKWVRAV